MPQILFITLSNIGDAVLTTPVLELLRQRYPTAEFDIVGDARSIDLFAHTPGLRQCYLKDKEARRRGSWDLLWALRQGRYDLVVDVRSPYLGHLLRAGQSLCVPWGRTTRTGHAAERHVAVLRPLLGDCPTPPVCVHVHAAERQAAAALLRGLPRPRVAIAPGARWPFKAWPVEHYRELMAALESEVGSFVLVGGEADRPRTQALAQAHAATTLDGAGQLRLLETAAVLAEVDLFIGNDSGAGHIAAGVGATTLSLFGPGEPLRYRPWSPDAHWLLAPQAELERLSPAEVALHARALLASPAQGRSRVSWS